MAASVYPLFTLEASEAVRHTAAHYVLCASGWHLHILLPDEISHRNSNLNSEDVLKRLQYSLVKKDIERSIFIGTLSEIKFTVFTRIFYLIDPLT